MSDSIGFLISDVSRLLRREFDARVRTIGVTRTQWRALTTLSRSEGINQGMLAEILEVEPITVGRMVDRLQEAGLVDRRADPADRRAWRLYLTEKSRNIISELRPIAERMFDETLEGFSSNEREEFVSYLSRLRANLSRPGDDKVAVNG